MGNERSYSGIYSRREAILRGLQIAGVGIAGGVVIAKRGPIGVAVGLANQAIEHPVETRRLLVAAVEHPLKAKDAFDLWNPPEEVYKQSPLLAVDLVYPSSTKKIIAVGLGDSGMLDMGGDTADSPVSLFTEAAEEKFGIVGESYNFAIKGATTKGVVESQLRAAKEIFDRVKVCDVWLQVGANDISRMNVGIEKLFQAVSLAKNPTNEPRLAVELGSRIMDNMDSLNQNFTQMLGVARGLYGSKISNLVIVLAPDFGKAPSIHYVPEEGAKAIEFDLQSDLSRRIAHNISVHLNNGITALAESFNARTGMPVILVDTFPSSHFGKDQHLTSAAKRSIINNMMDRVSIRT